VMHEMQHRKPTDRRELLGIIARSAVAVSRPTLYAMAIIIAALIPVFTLQRVEGRIFRPLALTYSLALLGALIFALTTVPAICAIVLRPRDAELREPAWLDWLRKRYQVWLRWLCAHRAVVFGGAALLLAAAIAIGTQLGSEFLPELDEGDFVIFVEMPSSIALDRGQTVLEEVRRRILTFPEVLATLSEQGRPEDGTDDEGVNMSETFVRLKPKEAWPSGMNKDKLIEAMRSELEAIPGVEFNFSSPIKDNVEEAVSGVRGKVVLKIYGEDFGAMRGTLDRAIDALHKVPGVVDLDIYRETTVPQLQIQLDRAALAREGISVEVAQRV
jgi:cobalt-zinc-cadmium resistance protein CzcA